MTGTAGIDTTQTHAFRQSPVRMAALAFGAILFVALGWMMMLGVGPTPRSERYQVIGAIAVAFFGFCLVMIVWRLFASRGPVVTVSPEGLSDTRIASKPIPWKGIERVGTWEAYRQKIIVVSVPPDIEASLGLSRAAKWSRKANRSLGADGLCITTAGLPVNADRLMQLILAYADAAQRN